MSRPYSIAVYKTANRLEPGWSWRLVAPNGRIIATPHDSYATRAHAVRSARDTLDAIQTRDIVCP